MTNMISKVADVIWNILAMVGFLTMLAMAGVFWFAWASHREEQRRARTRREERAWTHTPEAVHGHDGLRVWLDYIRDHGLHEIQPTKEDT